MSAVEKAIDELDELDKERLAVNALSVKVTSTLTALLAFLGLSIALVLGLLAVLVEKPDWPIGWCLLAAITVSIALFVPIAFLRRRQHTVAERASSAELAFRKLERKIARDAAEADAKLLNASIAASAAIATTVKRLEAVSEAQPRSNFLKRWLL